MNCIRLIFFFYSGSNMYKSNLMNNYKRVNNFSPCFLHWLTRILVKLSVALCATLNCVQNKNIQMKKWKKNIRWKKFIATNERTQYEINTNKKSTNTLIQYSPVNSLWMYFFFYSWSTHNNCNNALPPSHINLYNST